MNAAGPFVSVVIPAHQEELRIGRTLGTLLDYLEGHLEDTELIVVSAGSTDRTAEIARTFQGRGSTVVKVLDVDTRGKGEAVREGVLQASGQLILFTDADLSYAPALLAEFIARLRGGADVAIAHRNGHIRAGYGRRFVTALSRLCISTFLIDGIQDTQAGLKGFRREVALKLFEVQEVRGFLFDVEILLRARHYGYRIEQIPVDCEDQPGSKVKLFADTLRTGWDLAKMYWRLSGITPSSDRTSVSERQASESE